MKRVWLEDIAKHEGKEIKLVGWVFNKRSSGKIKFLLVRDGSGVVQCILSKFDVSEEIFNKYQDVSIECYVEIIGVQRKEERSLSGYELDIKDFNVIGKSEEYPIGKKEHGVDFLLNNRHLWLRSTKQRAILKIRHEVIRAARDFFNNLGFINVDAPIFTPNACEGTTTLFEVDYFDNKAFLSQSGQLYNEAAVMAHGKVYCFGPVFRAEKSKTRRHLTEFWQIEPEIAYINIDENMQLQEDMTLFILKRVLENREQELKVLERDIDFLKAIKGPFPRVKYDDAVKILKDLGEEVEWGDDFGAPQETKLTEQYKTPIFLHRFPAKIKPFYMQRDPEDERLSLGVDMLAPEGYGEIIGGGQRMEDPIALREKIKEEGLSEDDFKWFLDLREYGTVPHGGFGLGIERCVAWITGTQHIRECIPFPRTIYRLEP